MEVDIDIIQVLEGATVDQICEDLQLQPLNIQSVKYSTAELYSYFHIQLHHRRTPSVGNFPCSDHVVDELGNSYYGYIVDFVLILTDG